MALVAVNPIVLKDVELLFGATDDYAAHVSQVEFTPSASQVTWKGLSPEANFTDTATATWTCTLAYAQDWSEDGLSRFLFEHEGESQPVTFRPVKGGGPSFTATLVITPGAIGGTVDAYAAATVTLGVTGRPQLVDPA